MITTAIGGTISEHSVDMLQDTALGYYFARASVQPNDVRLWSVWARFVRIYSVLFGLQATYAAMDALWTRHQSFAGEILDRLAAEWHAEQN